jgi:subtilase family serine protease
MDMKLLSLILSIMLVSSFLVLAETGTSQPEEMNLEGRIFLWDGTTPLQGLPWEDTTPFTIWVYHSGIWNRFPRTGWVLTSGGWYAYTLEASERDINWSDGDTYRVQIDATAFGGLNTNATSHGSGDPGEYPPFGELENVIMWSDPDNTQQWDVVTPVVDLQPFALAIDGVGYPGPYDPSSPIGPLVVSAGLSHSVEANVTNEGTPLIRILNTATLSDSCGTLIHMGEIQEIGAWSSAPTNSRFSYMWNAPSLPFVGECLLNYTVDFYGNVTEHDETNNYAAILFDVEAPDLTPSDIIVQIPAATYSYVDASSTLPPFHSEIIPVNPGENVNISLNATNVGGYETGIQFNVVIAETGNVSGGPPVSVLFNSGEVGPLLGGSSVGPFVHSLTIPNETGHYCLNLTVDYGLDGSGNLSEVAETNNTFVLCFGIDVPDLTPYDIIIELEDGSSFAYPDISAFNYTSDPIYVFPGDRINITASVRNVGVYPSPVGVQTQISFYRVGDDPTNAIEEEIAEWDSVPRLLPGSTIGPFTFVGYSVPFILGDQYINVTVDNRSRVQEASETNNTFTIHLFVGGPDVLPRQVNLTVDGFASQYIYPETPTVVVDITSTVLVEALVENQGRFGTNGTFTTEFLDDSVAFHSDLTGPLASDEQVPTNSNWANPGVPGTHTITIVVDSTNDIEEVNETNNMFTLYIVIEGPDLVPFNISIDVSGKTGHYQLSDSPVGPIVADISEDVRFNVTIANQGGNVAGTSSVGFLDGFGLFNLSIPLGPLNPSSLASLSDIAWPNPRVPGDYFIAITADYMGNVTEVDEGNNDFDILLRVVGPDIVALEVLVNDAPYTGPVAVTGGETLSLDGLALNAGTNITPASFTVSIYDTSDRENPLLLVVVPQLAPGAYQWFNASWLAPMDFLNASLSFEVDFYDEILETNEMNNSIEILLSVTPLPPDLEAAGPEINGLPYVGPHEVRGGKTLLFSVSVRNIGSYMTLGSFDNAFYNETAPSFPFGTEVEAPLASGGMTDEIEATWKAPKKPGIYVVEFQADYSDTIVEANESNNIIRFMINVLEEEKEINWKPLLALLFALVLLASGVLAGYLRPLDRFVPIPRGMSKRGMKLYRKQMRSIPIGEKLKTLDHETLLKKFGKDRLFTILMLALPLSLTEGIIAILSFLSGILRVPEGGNWITVGLIVNIIILMVGISLTILVLRKGYRVPAEVLAPPPPEDDLKD